MSGFARLLIAVFVLLAQTGLGRAAVPCPEVEKRIEAVCPMTQIPGCNCCGEKDDPKPKAECELKSARDSTAQATLSEAFVPVVFSILPNEMPVVSTVPVEVWFEPPHLVVPRIRTPDLWEHPLRAPPAS